MKTGNCSVKKKTLALTWLQTFLWWGEQTRSCDLTWPDPAFFFWNVRNEKLGKVTKYKLNNILWRLNMVQEKTESGALQAPSARHRVKGSSSDTSLRPWYVRLNHKSSLLLIQWLIKLINIITFHSLSTLMKFFICCKAGWNEILHYHCIGWDYGTAPKTDF